MKTQFHFVTIVKSTFEHAEGAPGSKLVSSDVRLEISDNLDKEQYFDGGMPAEPASKPTIVCLIAGLMATMRFVAQQGWMSEGEVMRYVTKELQETFVTPSEPPHEGSMEY